MQKIFKLNNDGDTLVVDINGNKKVNIQLGDEEVNFFLNNPEIRKFEMEYMNNFLTHRLEVSLANKIHNEVGAIVGHPAKKQEVEEPINLFGETVSAERGKRRYAKRRSKYSHYFIRVYDKQWNVVFERTNTFYTMADAKKYAQDSIRETGVGMKSRIVVRKA
jgi:hypothetical protein